MSENKGLFDEFSRLCEQDRIMYGSDAEGIGTYNEKRFHRVFKRFVTEDASCYEVKIGRFIADVLCDGHITEIQTSNFASLKKKIEYYLTETEYTVSVVKPLICERKIVRADKKTGEVKYVRRSPRKESVNDALCDLYYLRDFLTNDRLLVHLMYVRAEEYRYSERVRYRKKGAFDSDLFPIEIVREEVLCGAQDYLRFMPQELRSGEDFTVKDYSRHTSIQGIAAYSALNILVSLGFLQKRTEGKKFIFRFNC